jgi:murein L,D-transpeptidase YafK
MGTSRHLRHWRVLGVLLLSLSGAGTSAAANLPAPPAAARNANPEALLGDIYKDLSQHDLNAAQKKADALVETYPNFRLGHLIRGDILLMHTRPVSGLGAAAPAGAESRVADLRREAVVRLQAAPGRPDAALLPRALLQLRKDQKHALIVDARHSRLYLYENRSDGLHLIQDFYVSQGKLGINKLKEGDMRTPVGVYYIVGRLAGVKLPNIYGKGALPLDYPNDWDKVHGRGGSGIWVHGTPAETFSRPPLSTDGCVVVSNDDLNLLTRTVEIGTTPVLIGDQVDFVNREQRDQDLRQAQGLLESWRRGMENRDDSSLKALYSPRFKSAADGNATTWLAKNQILPAARKVQVTTTDASFFRQPSQEEIIVSNFTQETTIGKFHHAVRKKQYWAKEGQSWKIVAETSF